MREEVAKVHSEFLEPGSFQLARNSGALGDNPSVETQSVETMSCSRTAIEGSRSERKKKNDTADQRKSRGLYW